MKKVLLSAVALLAFGFANAQEEEKGNGGFAKGDVFVSGAVTLGSAKTGDFKANAFEIAPKVGYFVTENIAVGASVGFQSLKWDDGAADVTNSGLGLGAFGRYYMAPASQFSVFGELAAGFGSDKTEDALGNETKYNGFGINAGVGVSYFLNSNFAIEAGWAGLGYNSRKADVSGADAVNSFGLNVDLSSINFGLIYKL